MKKMQVEDLGVEKSDQDKKVFFHSAKKSGGSSFSMKTTQIPKLASRGVCRWKHPGASAAPGRARRGCEQAQTPTLASFGLSRAKRVIVLSCPVAWSCPLRRRTPPTHDSPTQTDSARAHKTRVSALRLTDTACGLRPTSYVFQPGSVASIESVWVGLIGQLLTECDLYQIVTYYC